MPAMKSLTAVFCVSAPLALDAAAAAANPIRKVVTKLQNIEKEVQQEGEKQKQLFEEFKCQCKSTGGDLTKSIASAQEKISSLPSDIEAAEEALVQTKEALKQAQVDRSAAKKAIAEANAIREKEAAAFKSEKDELEANINAINKAVAAIEKGQGGAFLQLGEAALVERIASSQKDMDEDRRDEILSFLSGESKSPASGEIVGILKELGDDMNRNLADATQDEDAKRRTYDGLISAKTKEVDACGQAIEDKTRKSGELGIEIVEMKDDQSDTEKAFAEDTKFLADLKKNCASKTAEFEEATRTRGDELAAIGDTIKLLNSDEALEMFKKTLPSASASFLQMSVSTRDVERRAVSLMRKARDAAMHRHRAGFGLIALALEGKTVDFSKVLAMIDDMVKVLTEEQEADDRKVEYCKAEFDVVDDKKKALARTLSQEETSIDKATEAIATLTDEISALEMGLRALDRSVARAADQRKAENQEFNQMMQDDAAAKALLDMAKQRLNKFYNSFAQVSARAQVNGAGHKVIAMLDELIADLDKEMTEGKASEAEAQKDYESFAQDAQDKRATDFQSLEEKNAVKADTEGALQDHKGMRAAAEKENMATLQFDSNLHAECDWIMQNLQMRTSARNGEIDSLKKAKDVLNGADFSFVQKRVSRHLRH